MKKISVLAAFILCAAGFSGAAGQWSGLKYIKSIQYGYEENTYFQGMYVQVTTMEGVLYGYYSNQPQCSEDRAKSILAVALTAKSTGDGVVFEETNTSSHVFRNISLGAQ